MQLYFIRHGQSVNNALSERTRSDLRASPDPELTELGRLQAELVGHFLLEPSLPEQDAAYDLQNASGFAITHLYTSLMVRAVATGTIIADILGLPLYAWVDLHEEGGMFWEDEITKVRKGLPGYNRAYFQEHYPSLVLPGSLGEEGWWNRPFEEDDERPARARRFLDELLKRHGGSEDRVAVISHGGFYDRFLSTLLGMPKKEGYWFAINNAAITRIDFHEHEEEVGVVYQNRLDFMPRDMIS
jgi:2,3-bisphosphoglycerate-dependent phosphoglycerate mutase